MGIAYLYAKRSKALRKQVGACLVTSNGVVLGGYNGQPSGWGNTCEDVLPCGSLRTKSTTLHAEHNSILKAAREGVSTKGSTVYVTTAPCELCGAMLAQVGVAKVVYDEEYESASQTGSAVKILQENNIKVEKYKPSF